MRGRLPGRAAGKTRPRSCQARSRALSGISEQYGNIDITCWNHAATHVLQRSEHQAQAVLLPLKADSTGDFENFNAERRQGPLAAEGKNH